MGYPPKHLVRGGTMAGMIGSFPKWRSRALNSRTMGQEGRGAHRGSGGGIHGVRDGLLEAWSTTAVLWREIERVGEDESDQAMTRPPN